MIVGEGPQGEELRVKSQELGLGDKISFLGKLDQKILFEYIKASDVFVLNTSYEGFSHQIIETMALGTPIVTTDVGGNPEAIKDRNTGILVPFDDKDRILQGIVDIIRDSTLRERMVTEAKKKVKEFTDEKMLEKISLLLKNI
jgi:glycosyltransferase involved in cell wall biosynthesis